MCEHRLLKWSSQTCFGLRECGAGFKPAHYPQPPDACTLEIALFTINLRLPCDGKRNVLRGSYLCGPRKARRSNTHNRESNVIDIDLLTYNCGVAVESAGPETMTQNRGRSRSRIVVSI